MLDALEKMSVGQKNAFQDVCNKLLNQTFLSKDKKDNKDAYYFLINFKEIFDEFFSILGYEIELDSNLGTVMIKSESVSNVLKLKRDESIILLLLRLLYHEKMKETSLNENVVCSVSDIQSKYDYLEIKRKINKTDLIASLRLFRKYNLIEVIGDIQNLTTARVIILPTILMAVTSEDINTIYQTVNKLSSEGAE